MDQLQIAGLRDRLNRTQDNLFSRARSHRPARERIVEAADYLLARWGIRCVTLKQIAERAETTTGFVIECFGSLEGVVVDYLQRRVEGGIQADEEFWKALQREYPRAADEQLRIWIRVVAPKPSGPLYALPFSRETMELVHDNNHKGRAVIREYKTALRNQLAKLCGDAFYRDSEVLADKLLMLVEGARIQAATFGGEEPGKRLIEATEDLFKRHSQPQ